MPSEPDHPLDSRFDHIAFKGSPPDHYPAISPPGSPPVARAQPIRIPSADELEQHPMEDVAFVRRVLRMAGIRADGYRLTPLVRRIPACLRALRARDQETADRIVANDVHRLQLAVNALLIGTTSFFRDHTVFQQLDQTVVPALLTARERPRIWSAACSDGSELASIAMLFAKHGGIERSEFLGTDCRSSAIAFAAEGRYPLESADLLPPDMSERFLLRNEKGCRVHPSIRSRLNWKLADILAEPAGNAWDMILCRNLAIYLHPHQAHQLWIELHAALSPGGYLVVGKAEKPQIDGLYRVSTCIYRKDLHSPS